MSRDPYWRQTEPSVSYQNRPVHVNNRMTQYESRLFKYKAARLLETINGEPTREHYNIKRWIAYCNHNRIGAFMSIDHDPLDNGLIVGNFEDFTVEAVKPIDNETVLIRFAYQGDIDL